MTHAQRYQKWITENPDAMKECFQKAGVRFELTEKQCWEKINDLIWWLEVNEDTGKANKRAWKRFTMNNMNPNRRFARRRKNASKRISKFNGKAEIKPF